MTAPSTLPTSEPDAAPFAKSFASTSSARSPSSRQASESRSSSSTATSSLLKLVPYAGPHLALNLRKGLDEISRSRMSDGVNSLEDMAHAAQELGYDYIGITDHSHSLKIANGEFIESLRTQIRTIDRLNAASPEFAYSSPRRWTSSPTAHSTFPSTY